MKITREHNGVEHTLYHAQNMNICSDGTPYDLFFWCDHEPTQEDLDREFIEDYGDNNILEEWQATTECYAVYVKY